MGNNATTRLRRTGDCWHGEFFVGHIGVSTRMGKWLAYGNLQTRRILRLCHHNAYPDHLIVLRCFGRNCELSGAGNHKQTIHWLVNISCGYSIAVPQYLLRNSTSLCCDSRQHQE